MNTGADFSPDPLLEFPGEIEFSQEFENKYTAPYKLCYSARSPIMCVVSIEQTDDVLHPYSTYGLQILPYVRQRPRENHGIILVELDKYLTSIGNVIKKDFFLYDYIRCLYQVHHGMGIEKSASHVLAKESIEKYQCEFGFCDVFDTLNKYFEFANMMFQKFRYELVMTNRRFRNINEVQSKLEEINPEEWFDQSEPKTLMKTYKFQPVLLNNERIDENYGDFIFDNTVLSERLPYLVYYDSYSDATYKVYRELVSDSTLDYQKIIDKASRTPKANTIEFVLWLGEGSLYKTTASSFFSGIFDLVKGTITYSVPITLGDKQVEYEPLAKKVLEHSFSYVLNIEDFEVVRSQAEFNLYPLRDGEGNFNPEKGVFNFEEFMLLHEFTQNNMFRHIVYPDEKIFPYFKRSRLEFVYTPMFMQDYTDQLDSHVSWSMTLRKTQSYISYPLKDGKSFKGREGNFLRIKIVNADNEKVANETINVLIPLLCIFYRDVVLQPDNINREYYKSVITNVVEIENIYRQRKFKSDDAKEDLKSTISREGAARLKEYSRKYPNVFQDRYKVLCRSHKTPIIFDNEDDAIAWCKKKQVDYMPYPATEPIFWFASNHDNYKYPNIVANEDPETYKILPYYPCTSNSDMRKHPNSDYAEFYLGKNRIFNPTTTEKKPKKLLNAGDYGELETMLSTFLNSEGENPTIFRFGCCRQGSKNSFIHSILYASGDPEYMKLFPPRFPNAKIEGRETYMRYIISREEYVKSIRQKLGSSVHISLLAQELYDVLPESRKSVLNNLNSYIDPSLFYRLFEELYRINIFVFNKNGYEIPRHRDFSVRHFNMDAPCVLLYKNTEGAIPHIELVVNKGGLPYFDSRMTQKCASVHNMMLSTLTIIKDPYSNVGTHSNIYALLDYVDIFSDSISGQHIDGHGKARGFDVNLVGTKMTVFTHPGQPLNVPSTNIIYRTTIEMANRFFRDFPSSVTLGLNGKVNGLWYRCYDIEYCFYVMLSTEIERGNFRRGPNYVPIIYAPSEIPGLIEQERTLSLIKQLVLWVFDVYRYIFPEDTKGIDLMFCDSVLTSLITRVSSIGYYRFDHLNKILPVITNYQKCLEYLHKNTSKLVYYDGEKYFFLFHSKEFRDKIVQHVRVYYKNSYNDVIKARRVLDDYRTTYNSFKQQEGVEVLIGQKSFNVWLTGIADVKNSKTEILSEVDLSMVKEVNPYLYSDEKGDLYLIQNIEGEYNSNQIEPTHDELREKAIKVALKWREEKINVGYYVVDRATPDKYKKYAIVTYAVGNNKRFIPISIIGPTDVEYLSIIKFSDVSEFDTRFRYGAMLPLN